jgi:hypothetical protein
VWELVLVLASAQERVLVLVLVLVLASAQERVLALGKATVPV